MHYTSQTMHHFPRPYIRCLFITHLSQRADSGGFIEARSIHMGAKQTQQLERQTLHTHILESLPPALVHFNGLQRDGIMEYLAYAIQYSERNQSAPNNRAE